MISQTAEYALRAVVYLASQGGEARSVQQIAATTRVPTGYLAKVMQSLSRAGLVQSWRGAAGGFSLSHAPEKVSVLDVINVVEPIRRFPECPLGLPGHAGRLCPLHQQLDDAGRQLEAAFRGQMLSDIAELPSGRRRMCPFPVAGADAT